MPKTKYTEEQKEMAFTLLRGGATQVEAARQSGIGLNYLRAMIYRRRKQVRDTQKQVAEDTKSVVKGAAYTVADEEVKRLFREEEDTVRDMVREAVADRTKELQEKLFEMISLAVEEAISIMETGPTDKESRGAWLRAVIGAIAQGVEKHQLLVGKPTGRLEQGGQVTQRHEYGITQRIISDSETARLADQLLQRAANSDTGMVRTLNKPWTMAAIRSPVAPEPEDS